MTADVAASLKDWSTTLASNQPQGTTAIGANLDDNLRQIQTTVRYLYAADTIASATTTDIGTKESGQLTVTGTTTITGFGTVSAGICKWVTFASVLLLTYNATSMILPGALSISTAAGDVAFMQSLGSGNWKCLSYTKANGGAVIQVPSMPDGTAAAPGLFFANDTNTGIYRVTTDTVGISAGGAVAASFGPSAITFAIATTFSAAATFSSAAQFRTSANHYSSLISTNFMTVDCANCHVSFNSNASVAARPAIASNFPMTCAGTDNAFRVSVATLGDTGFTATFANAFATRPVVIAQHNSGTVGLVSSKLECVATTTNVYVYATDLVNLPVGSVIDVICFGVVS